MKIGLKLSLALIVATVPLSCRVVPGQVDGSPGVLNQSIESNVQSQIIPALRSVTSSIQTVGIVYKASKKISRSGDSDPSEVRLIDGASLFEPSSEDELKYARRDDANEVYDFNYKLAGTRSVTMKESGVTLAVNVSGIFKVKDGDVSISELKVEAQASGMDSSSGTSDGEDTFGIATLATASEGGMTYHVSFSEFKRLLKFINDGGRLGSTSDEGVLEITISKEEAKLDVVNLLISDVGQIRLNHLTGIWAFKNRYFKSDARIQFMEQDEQLMGIDLQLDESGELKTRVWKDENRQNAGELREGESI